MAEDEQGYQIYPEYDEEDPSGNTFTRIKQQSPRKEYHITLVAEDVEVTF
jgi:hypothetical protein